MRVLAVGTLYPPHHLGGGYELVWAAAMADLRARGHDVRVLCTEHRRPGAGADESPAPRRGLRWYWRDHAFPRMGVRAQIELERHNARILAEELDAHRPDVVTWWPMGGLSLSLLERVRRTGVRSVAFVHDDWLVYGPRVDGWLRRFRGRRPLTTLAERATGLPATVDWAGAARYVFVSEHTRRRATRARAADTGIAHSGIDPAFLDRTAPLRPWEGRLLAVGRIDPRKGLETAIEALAMLPDATLTIAGSGDEAEVERLRARAEALGVAGRVVWTGGVSRADLPAVYIAADAVLFPVTWDEPWGLVPLEAMAIGRPVIATGRGGSAEYLEDGGNALLHPAGDAAALADRVRRLAGDEALRDHLRAGGLATAPRHTETVFHAAVAAEVEG